MVYDDGSFPFPPRGRNGLGAPWPPWWYAVSSLPYGGDAPGASSATAIARDVDSLLLPVQPGERISRLIEEIDALAVIDRSVQEACELLATEVQPCLDEDEDGVLSQLLWLNAQDLMSSPVIRAGLHRILRSGPTLVAMTRWQLQGRMRSAVLRSAGTELRSRRPSEPALDERLQAAGRELATAIPEQKGPLALGLLIVAGTGAMTFAADAIFESQTGMHLWETTPS
jgi:hypothetical protein